MALSQLARPAYQSQGSLRPPTDIQPQVGVYYDAQGNPHQAYMSADGSAANGGAITPSDSTVLTPPTRALYVGGAGDVTVVTVGGSVLDFKAVPVGTTLPVQAQMVKATGTTATFILGLW